MKDSETYLTPAGCGEATLTEKRSKFLARVWPVADETEALARIDAIRREHHNATHNVFAYAIRNGPVRYGDDGEPQGTAGLPTLGVFQKGGISNVCCVVVRYYGGILLGGGLARAYGTVGRMALEQAGIAMVRQWYEVLVPCPYALLETVRVVIASCGGSVVSTDYGTDVLIEALLPKEEAERCATLLRDASAGDIEMETVALSWRAGGRL